MDNSTCAILLERRDDGVAVLTLNRAADRNLVDESFARAMLAHAATLADATDVRCVLLRAEGSMFSAGGDVRDMQAHADDLPGHIDRLIRPVHEAIAAFHALPMPVVACVQGTAAGGGLSLALACDVVIAARSARLVFAYAKLGTTPDCGLTHALTERLGPVPALQLLLTRDSLTAEEALHTGLVQQVTDDDAVLDVAQAMAARICAMPPQAARGLKRLLLGDARGRLQARLDAEHESFVSCARTDEFKKRVTGFGKARNG